MTATQPPADNELMKLAEAYANATASHSWHNTLESGNRAVGAKTAFATALSAQAARLAAAVAAERERCARVAESLAWTGKGNDPITAERCAAAIRTTQGARVGETPEGGG